MRNIRLLILPFLMIVLSCTEEVTFDFEENLEVELGQIDQFLSDHDISANVHETALRYRTTVEGTGPVAQEGDTLLFFYQIYLLDSTLVDTNIEEVQQAHNYSGSSRVGPDIQIIYSSTNFDRRRDYFGFAFERAKEEKVIQMFVPSYLAFGSRGRIYGINTTVPPNTPVLAQIEITEIRR